jgi:hypothetical protein
MSDTHGCKHDPKCGLWGTGHTDIASGHTTMDIPLFTPVAHGSCRPNTTQQRGEPSCMEDSISKTANRGFQAPIQHSCFTPSYGYRRTAKAKAGGRARWGPPLHRARFELRTCRIAGTRASGYEVRGSTGCREPQLKRI